MQLRKKRLSAGLAILSVSILAFLVFKGDQVKQEESTKSKAATALVSAQKKADKPKSIDKALTALDEVVELQAKLSKEAKEQQEVENTDLYENDEQIKEYKKAFETAKKQLVSTRKQFQKLSQQYDEHLLNTEGEPDYLLLEEINSQQEELEEQLLEQSREMIEAYQTLHRAKVEMVREKLAQLSQGVLQ